MALVLLPQACLSPTPEYDVPEQVAPFFAMDRADPATLGVLTVPGNVNEQKFNVPFRSQDSGESLRVIFVRDIEPAEPPSYERIIDSSEVAADDRPISEQGTSRAISFTWVWRGDERPVSKPAKPTTFTMILAHESNFVGITYRLVDALDSAQATWLFNFEPTGGE
jgi:hypothetical protein